MIMLRHKIKKCEFVLKFVFCLAFSIIMYIVVGVFAVAPYGDNPVEKEETVVAVDEADGNRQELRH